MRLLPSTPVLAAWTLSSLAAAQSPIVVVPPERGLALPLSPEVPTPISSVLADAFTMGADRVSLGPLRSEELLAAVAAEDCTSCRAFEPYRLGLTRSFDAAQTAAQFAAWKSHDVGPGERVWTLAVESPGAYGMRLHFEGVDLAERELTVWAWNGAAALARGPYTGFGPHESGEFWNPSLPGSTSYIEVTGDERPRLFVREVAHYDRPIAGSTLEDTGSGQPAGGSHPCHIDVDCPPLTGGLGIARDATGQMNFMTNGQWFRCSGTMLSDLEPSTQELWFLTAFHCLSTEAEANTLEVVWGYQKSSCSASPPDWFLLERNCGADVLETNPTNGGNDMTFLRLDGALKPGVAFAGFTNAEPASGLYFGIHHPAGDVKKITKMSESGLFLCPFVYDQDDYDYFEATEGLTEGGSSGSGLFRSDGIVLGQLTGKCCEAWIGLECEDADCSNQSEWRMVYGESAITWPFIEKWLVTGGVLHVDKANTSPPYDGTAANPYPSVTQGAAAAFAGATLKIHAGSYAETLTVGSGLVLDATGGSAVIGQ